MKKAKKSMKKKKDWQTKAKKRKYREQDRGILGVVFIVKHFWKNLTEWIEKMEDPRNQSYITYTQSDYVYMVLFGRLNDAFIVTLNATILY